MSNTSTCIKFKKIKSSAVCEQFILFYVSFLFLVLFSFFWFCFRGFFQNPIHYLNAHTLTTGFEWYQTKLNKQDLHTHMASYSQERKGVGLPGKALISLNISTHTNVYTHNHISYAIGTTMDKSYKVRFIGDK